MTRIAYFTDIHGNLPALEAILVATEDADLRFFGGDAIGMGPQPGEVVERLAAVENLTCVMGNHDKWLLTGVPFVMPYRRHHRWGHQQVNMPEQLFVAEWPMRHDVELAGVRITMLHYALDGDDWKDFVEDPNSPPAVFDELFAGVNADLILYGHHHPFSDVQGRARYVNPGSAGCHDRPEARYCIIDVSDGAFTLTYHAAPYDDAALAAAFAAQPVPAKDVVIRIFFGDRFGGDS